MKWTMVVTIGIALFSVGRCAHRPASPHAAAPSDRQPAASAPAAPGSSTARRAQMQTLLTRLANAPAAKASPTIARSSVEPPEVTAKRRQRALAEIDERAPGLAAAKREVLLAEADRLAWDKRQLRAAFLDGELSEADYVAALKDDIRAALANFEETLSADEYVALFNRRPGGDPFTMESLVGRPADKQLAP